MKFDPNSNALPMRSELPAISGAPAGAAWFWGSDDELGRLNLLTKERIEEAVKLIKTGTIINLKSVHDQMTTAHQETNTSILQSWRTDYPDPPSFGRKGFEHTIQPVSESAYDDLYNMNTQSGSQWDGFRHVGLRSNNNIIFYNGLTKDAIPNAKYGGMQAWAEHGIAGRGILIDYWGYTGKSYDPITTHRISLEDIHACAKSQGLQFQYGDLLFIRSGFVDHYNRLSETERKHLGMLKKSEHAFVGVEQTEEMLDFLHNNYFSAVVGDAPAFEAWPRSGINLHEYLLPLWGLPIGEMWDLDKLAEMCRSRKQYTFFISSAPANVPGGIGSHPNAIAIF
ncbi:hypothetical protein LTR84_009119 [Exophiala bonariae]|uniref:Cyclase n=1 Tax=Exophiala bonariae TaxID=1690606 RepID=A0AAV9MV12_9EURO|nr:hypothetical protein LTR84_009119 [Exophiala bonariae]